MPARTRSKPAVGGRIIETISDNLPGPGGCSHLVIKPANKSDAWAKWGSSLAAPYYISQFEITNSCTVPPSVLQSLNRSKLPSSTEAGLLQIIAELDDTIGMFTVKFWKQLSYGSLNWGVLPFLADLKAVIKACKNYDNIFKNVKYEDQVEHTMPEKKFFYNNGGWLVHTVSSPKVKVRFTGAVYMEQVDYLLQSLDYIGLHPDLATAWDLVPLSFLIDYLIPIGDFLESFQGWVRNVPFKGWTTIKTTANFYEEILEYALNPSQRPYRKSSQGEYRRFDRFYRPKSLVAPPPEFNFEIPSLRECFNILYVLKQKS